MSYTKTDWKDRVVENPRTYTLVDNGDGTVTLTPSPGTVVQEGTPVNASNLNNLETQYDKAKADLDAALHATTGHKHTGEAGQGPALIHHQTFTESGTWTKPTGCKVVYVECVGGGGGGSSGASENSTKNHRAGGGYGGGGAARIRRIFRVDELPSEVEVIVGAGGTGGGGTWGGGSRSNGGTGGTSKFGDFVAAYGGKGGTSLSSGSHGGGCHGPGAPLSAKDQDAFGGQAGYGGHVDYYPCKAEWGGGGGGVGYVSSSYEYGPHPGARSEHGGGGGGGGGGGSDRSSGVWVARGGGSSGAYAGGAGGSTVRGEDGSDGIGGSGGGGGAGQYYNIDGHAGNGGKGGAPGGGGGGGGGRGYSDSGLRMSGKGGDGGRGEVRIWAW